MGQQLGGGTHQEGVAPGRVHEKREKCRLYRVSLCRWRRYELQGGRAVTRQRHSHWPWVGELTLVIGVSVEWLADVLAIGPELIVAAVESRDEGWTESRARAGEAWARTRKLEAALGPSTRLYRRNSTSQRSSCSPTRDPELLCAHRPRVSRCSTRHEPRAAQLVACPPPRLWAALTQPTTQTRSRRASPRTLRPPSRRLGSARASTRAASSQATFSPSAAWTAL